MANNSATQQALADDRRFQDRLENALGKVAWEILGEDPLTVHHAERAAYANRVLSSPQQVASQLASSFVGGPNVFGFETSYDFTVGGVVTAAGDADIESQLHTDWNQLAGVVAWTHRLDQAAYWKMRALLAECQRCAVVATSARDIFQVAEQRQTAYLKELGINPKAPSWTMDDDTCTVTTADEKAAL